MNKEAKLQLEIEKAQKNGWYKDTEFKIIHYDGSIGTSMFLHGTFEDDGRIETWQRDVETLIFSESFCRAYFGERTIKIIEYCNCDNRDYEPVDGYDIKSCPKCGWMVKRSEEVINEGWNYHRHQMLDSDDVVEYMWGVYE